MLWLVRSIIVVAERVLDFIKKYPLTAPGHATAAALFEERLATVNSLAAVQADGQLTARAAREGREDMREQLETRHLRHLVTVAEEGRRRDPERFAVFRSTSRLTSVNFALAVRSMAVAAKEQKDALMALGLGETVLADLEGAITEYLRHDRDASAARASHAAATKALEKATSDLRSSLDVLDGIYRYALGAGTKPMEEWIKVRSARRKARKADDPTPPGQGGETKTA